MKNKDTARILIVDDQVHALQGVSRIMGNAGYEVLGASNGEDCMKLAARHKPDLILLDVVLPDIDGREVCRRIKSDPETADSYVVLFSSTHIDSDIQAEGLEHGADGYIARPLPNRELLARVKAILRLKFAENRLRENEERYRRISSLTSDIAYSCIKSNNTAYSIDWIMGAVERITGHSEEDIKALGCWSALVIDEDRAVFDTKVVGIAPGSTCSCELRLCHKSGRIVWVSSLSECVLVSGNPDGLRLYGGLVDITERKIDEETLRISEEKFSKTFHLNPDAILITRLVDGMIVTVNEGFKQIFGATEEEVIGKTALELNIWANPEDRNRVIEGLKTEGKVNNFEFSFRTKDGDIRYGLMSASIITLAGVSHALSITRDITESKMAREQLLQAQKMEAIGTLAGGFAHDFNNKLQVIDGYVDLMLFEKDLPETAKSKLEVIKQTVHSSAELIKGMMVFVRKTPLELRPIELNKLVAQTRAMLSRSMPKMIEIDLLLEDDLWTINAAPNQIDQILMNLAINARDAMPDGGKLTIQTQNTILDQEHCRYHPNTKPGRYVRLSVTNSGIGMDHDTVKHIFEPFFTTKESGKGTGLGLSVVYGIVEKHGGWIICFSEPSEGTTFKIYFPAIEEIPEEQYSGNKESPKGRGETILLVDDEPHLLDLVSRQLVGANYRVIKASNGNEALNLYEQQREQISLVILDLLMPEMDGRRCLEALRDIDPNIRVLIATGHTTPDMVGELEQAGAKGFIRKPFDFSLLLEEIRKIIDEE